MLIISAPFYRHMVFTALWSKTDGSNIFLNQKCENNVIFSPLFPLSKSSLYKLKINLRKLPHIGKNQPYATAL